MIFLLLYRKQQITCTSNYNLFNMLPVARRRQPLVFAWARNKPLGGGRLNKINKAGYNKNNATQLFESVSFE